jgi:peroxiredoxin Q/BCP
MLKLGDKAPEFSLKDRYGKVHSSKKIKTDYLVVYFYPKDNTPGCTTEALGFNRDLKKYEELNATVVGISGGDEKSKTKFCEKHGIDVLLLSDSGFSVSKKYGVYGKKKFMGREYMGINRTTFILDKNGKVIKVYKKVKPEINSQEVLEFLRGLN